MSGGVTLCFYLVIGAAVAVALWISKTSEIQSGRVFQTVTALLFWPLYLPVLLVSNGPGSRGNAAPDDRDRRRPDDGMATAIAQVELELDSALRSLNGWAGAVLSPKSDRFAELRSAWREQAERVRELDRLLSASANEPTPAESPAVEAQSSSENRITESERLRHENLSKLKLVRKQCHDDLMATLAWVRQLVTMIHLARYTGEPASRAAELVQQIADAVEGLSKQTG